MKKLISVLALLLLAGLLFSNWHKDRQIDKLAAQSGTLADSQAARVVVKDNKLTATVRQPDGTVKTEVKYAPPEGRAEVVQPTDGATEISVKRAGFTFRPAVQALVGKELNGGLGARLVYFDRSMAPVSAWTQIWKGTCL